MKPSALVATALLITLAGAAGARQEPAGPERVEPSELLRRKDLVGREVIVDDRVAFYVPRNGPEDELQLRRTPVTFLVPRSLRPPSESRAAGLGAVVQGTLERQGSQLLCRVTRLEPKPADLERLERSAAEIDGITVETAYAPAPADGGPAAVAGEIAAVRTAVTELVDLMTRTRAPLAEPPDGTRYPA